jgi:hypothetical protein
MSDKRSTAELVGNAMRKGALLVGRRWHYSGARRPRGDHSATSIVVVLAVAVGLFAIGVAIERRR